MVYFNLCAPCGAQPRRMTFLPVCSIFQFTCPVRGTTSFVPIVGRLEHISIYVPCAGHNVRSSIVVFTASSFQFMCPVRGTTLFLCPTGRNTQVISIYVPRAGHNSNLLYQYAIHEFQFMCPVRGTTAVAEKPAAVSVLNPKNANLSFGFFQTRILSL